MQELKVGDIVKIGKESSKACGLKAGTVIVLIGILDYDNGIYCETQTSPSIWNEERKEFDSIYHLFGNNLEDFLDSEVIDIQATVDKLEKFESNIYSIIERVWKKCVDCNKVYCDDMHNKVMNEVKIELKNI